MSWLLVGLIPGLLMLATFGLDRLEAGLTGDTVSATEVATFLSRASAADGNARQRSSSPESPIYGLTGNGATPDLPTRYYSHRAVNPEFQPTRHANRV
ncbi:hypothetical protein [Mycolicibacterium pulveris]|uniref:hypothetical protein n=1 Tax=Mycolicibacterium pulveris TaxID=36813 RepID=UPI003CECA2E0